MFSLMEKLSAWTRGLPEYAQFFFYLALACLILASVDQLVKEIGRYKGQLRGKRLARRIMQDYHATTAHQDEGTWKDEWGREFDEPVHTSCVREADIEGFVWDGKDCRQCSRTTECLQVYPIRLPTDSELKTLDDWKKFHNA